MFDSSEGLTYTAYDSAQHSVTDGCCTNPDMVSSSDGNFWDTHTVRAQTTHIVPNGKWVATTGYPPVVGVERSELEMVEYHDKKGVYQSMFICDKPFGFVSMDSYGRKTLVYARQVHKGELGQGVHIPTLECVIQASGPDTDPRASKAARKRRRRGWVKLAQLGEASVGYSPKSQVELVLGYWRFSGHRNHWHYSNDQTGGQLVDVAWGSSLDIKLGIAEFRSLTMKQFRKECSDTSEVWVRRGFALTILRLLALGVQPVVPQHA